MHSPADAAEPGVGPRTAFASIVAFWLFYFAVATLRAAVLDFDDQLALAARRAVVALASIGVTAAMWLLLRRWSGAGLARGIAAAALLSVPAALVYATVNQRVFQPLQPAPGAASIEVGDRGDVSAPPRVVAVIADTAVNGYFFFVAWAALYLALATAAEGRAAERRAARFRSAAQSAELRALRYQINPHFLFNTLNSLSSLVMADRRTEAERMILNLSTFFRSSLAGDPAADAPLGHEIALQRLYVAIEAVRFPDRLLLVEDIAPGLDDAPVPGLILQPLVENAVKHGVSRVRTPVTVAIRAWEEDGMLALSVSDDAHVPSVPSAGMGIGLANVADRLAARFGADAALRAGPLSGGGFAATVVLPLVRGHG